MFLQKGFRVTSPLSTKEIPSKVYETSRLEVKKKYWTIIIVERLEENYTLPQRSVNKLVLAAME